MLIQSQPTIGSDSRDYEPRHVSGFIKRNSTGALKRQIFSLNKLKPRILRDNQATPGPNRTSFNPSLGFFSSQPGERGWKGRKRKARRGCFIAALLSFAFPSFAPFHRSFESTRSLRAGIWPFPSPPFNQPLPYLCADRHSSRKIFLRSSKRTTLS